MALPLPTSLTPSKVTAFTECALAFRLSTIDRVPEPPSPAAVRGSLVHRALQLLMWDHPQGSRSPDVAHDCLTRALGDFRTDEEWLALSLDTQQQQTMADEARVLVDNYLRLEDPNTVNAIGVELMLEVSLGDIHLRGIIDRLDLDPDGELVITDYKTARAPSVMHERHRLEGVQFYAFLCESALGRRPSRVQLLYLGDATALMAVPSDQSIRGLQRRTRAIWTAIEKACTREDFRPNPGRLCEWCSFQPFCPAWGGDLSLAPRPTDPIRPMPGTVTPAGPGTPPVSVLEHV